MLDRIAQAMNHCEIVLQPDRDAPEWWAGAPSVVRSPDGAFYMAARMREGDSPKGQRGYEIRILRSEDGRRFEIVNRITREATGVPGFERPALVIDLATGLFRLYGCAGMESGWSILRFDDVQDPAQFNAATARVVLAPEQGGDWFARITAYKDPFIFQDSGIWHMFVIGADRVERIHHFVSPNGEQWSVAALAPVMENAGWHNFYTRPSCVLPLGMATSFVYEGSNLHWHDPNYNIVTGLAYTSIWKQFTDPTPEAPAFTSTTPGDYYTWRYSHWLPVGREIYVYFEAARPNNTNEIRLAVLPMNG